MHFASQKSRFSTAVRLFCVLLITGSAILPSMAGIAFADIPYDDNPWQGYPGYDVVLGGVWSRQAVENYMWRFDDRGFNANFAWYSNDTVIQSGSWDNRVWSSLGKDNAWSWSSGGYWWTPLKTLFYYSPATFRAYEYGGSFIAKVCGNFSWSAVNPAPPRISGYKWNDLDGDGVWDSGEPALSGWRINFYRNGAYAGYATTNSSGYYYFVIDATQGRRPGTWTMSEQLQSGWVQTKATSAVTVQEGSYSAGRNYGNNNFGNFKLGSVSGVKWSDADADGVKDPDEPQMAGIQVKLLKSGSVAATAITDSQGRYAFTGLRAGTYRVEEVVPEGWEQTYPLLPGYHERVIRSGSNFTDCDFGNVQFGSIRPLKVHDRNQNLLRDAGEELLGGWTMHLWDLEGWEFGSPIVTTEDTATTPAWDAVPSGQYIVSEDDLPGWDNTAPTTQTVAVAPGQESLVSFFNVGLGDIHGHKFHDYDRDSVMTAADDPIEGWLITLAQNGETVEQARTDDGGYYCFSDLAPGIYTVSEEERDNWTVTTGVCETVTVTPLSSTRIDFGNLHVGDISGTKREDMDGDGILDPEDTPLSGIEVTLATLDGSNVGEPVVTNASGAYRFEDVIPGTYVVTETVPDGWAPSAGTTRSVEVVGGQLTIAEAFLNVGLGTISGMKFDDCNANHVRDLQSTDETGLPGWEIQLWSNNGNGWSLEQTSTTDACGEYVFAGVWPGTYEVREVLRDNWVQTAAPSSPISTTSRTQVTGQDFGNIELAALDLYKWDDHNSNGIWEAGEPGIPGWEFSIEGTQVDGSTVETVAVTGDDGRITLEGLLPGTFSATEQAIGRTLEASGTVLEPGWRPTTSPSATLVLAEGSRESTSFGNIELGWIWGRVTHEVYKYGIPGIPIAIEETDQTVYTNDQGYFFFYDVEPNETSETPTPDYLVGMDLTGTGYLTRDAVEKAVSVPEGGSAYVPFTVIDEGVGNCPRTIGYWKNWDNHYTAAEMQTFLDLVNAGSAEFNDLTPDDVYQILQIDRKTGMEAKARAQFLAFWLNVSSGNLGWLTQVDVTPVEGWEAVVVSADADGLTTVIDFLGDIEDAFAAKVEDTWEIVKDLLDFFNNGRLT